MAVEYFISLCHAVYTIFVIIPKDLPTGKSGTFKEMHGVKYINKIRMFRY